LLVDTVRPLTAHVIPCHATSQETLVETGDVSLPRALKDALNTDEHRRAIPRLSSLAADRWTSTPHTGHRSMKLYQQEIADDEAFSAGDNNAPRTTKPWRMRQRRHALNGKAASEAAAGLRVKKAGTAVNVAAKVAAEAHASATADEQATKGSMSMCDDDDDAKPELVDDGEDATDVAAAALALAEPEVKLKKDFKVQIKIFSSRRL
jgi:hypothetical protein